jgi:hypothetical protein
MCKKSKRKLVAVGLSSDLALHWGESVSRKQSCQKQNLGSYIFVFLASTTIECCHQSVFVSQMRCQIIWFICHNDPNSTSSAIIRRTTQLVFPCSSARVRLD